MDELTPSPGPLTAIAVVGNINLDIKTSRIAASPGIMADGETTIEEIYETIGGGGANTAVAAGIMAAPVHFTGCVGDDDAGRRLVRHLRSVGVTPHVTTVPVPTGRSLALSWDNGHRHFISSLPNAARLDFQAVDMTALAKAGCGHMYRADIWFSEPMLFGGNARLFRESRAAGMETSIDINWDPHWNAGLEGAEVRRRIEAVRETLPFVDWVHGNERELLSFSGSRSVDGAVRVLADWGARAIIVHRGARGSAAFADGTWIETGPSPVQRVVSDTGSGDVFTAAFLIHGRLPLEERLKEAGRAAANHLQGTPCYIPPLERQ
jgi:ribokinase